MFVALVSGVFALASAGFAWRAQLVVTERKALHDKAAREEERRSQAKVVLDRYRGPLLDAAWHLGDRIDNIRNRAFFDFLIEGSGREEQAKLTTLFRFANYFGWREIVRREVQLLRFENEQDTRQAAVLLGDIAWIFSSDRLDGARSMLWGDEQRGIGELMALDRQATHSPIRGYAEFHRDYGEIFAPWMERFAKGLFIPPGANGQRLRLLHWALFGLVVVLDEEESYEKTGWIARARDEFHEINSPDSGSNVEASIRRHLAMLNDSPHQNRDADGGRN